LGQERLDVARAEAEAVVESHGMGDDLGRKAENGGRDRGQAPSSCPATCHINPAPANLRTLFGILTAQP
jgi:hypothetical protein